MRWSGLLSVDGWPGRRVTFDDVPRHLDGGDESAEHGPREVASAMSREGRMGSRPWDELSAVRLNVWDLDLDTVVSARDGRRLVQLVTPRTSLGEVE